MKKTGKIIVLLLAMLMFLPVAVKAEGTETTALDYSDKSNWAYYEEGKDTGVDIFMICPTVDYNTEDVNATLDENMKKRFLVGLAYEKGVYDDAGRIYSPYYRQIALAAYANSAVLPGAVKLAYGDVSASFRWYLDHENKGRGIILAGFSQGSQMCLELLKEYYGGNTEEAAALRKNLVSVYAIGWRLDEDTVKKYTQIVPASGEKDIGSVISYDCEDGTLEGTMLIPKDKKAVSINPLNWKTDKTEADKSLNLGSLVGNPKELKKEFCGAKIGDRGELIVTGINIDDFPPMPGSSGGSSFFPKGHLHVYDYDLFFSNLKKNVETRILAWRDVNKESEKSTEPEKSEESEKVTPKANKLIVKNKSVKVKYSKLEKKAQFIKASKVKKGNSAKTKITYKLVKVNKKKKAFTVASSGKIKVKKGTKKGTYKLTIKATAAKSASYLSADKNFAVTVKIK